MPSPDEINSTTQQFLDIYDITNNILILKDGGTALIITVNAMNFGLLAEPEQDAIMYAYAGLLNSLNYPIQIVIRSQTKDVTSYLGLLKDEEEKSTSDIKRSWINRYREFVAQLIKERNVLDKKFYVVIPASSLEMGLLPPSTVVPGVKQPDLSTVERSVILEKATEILEPKRDHLMAQFARIGLQSRQLATQEIIQLFYGSYNPEAAEGQQITDTNSYTTPLVEASIQGGTMDNANNPTSPTSITPPAPDAGNQGQTPTPQPAGSMTSNEPQMPATDSAAAVPAAPMNQPMPGQAGVSPIPTTQTPPAPAPSMTPPPPTGVANPTPGASLPPTPGETAPNPNEVLAQAQDEINSTLKELGGEASGTPVVGGAPSAQTPAGSAVAGVQPPVNNPVPASSPTPAVGGGATGTTNSGAGNGQAASGDAGKSGDNMPPLPEI